MEKATDLNVTDAKKSKKRMNKKNGQKKLSDKKSRRIKKGISKPPQKKSKGESNSLKKKQNNDETHIRSIRQQLCLERTKQQQKEFKCLLRQMKKENIFNETGKKCIFALRNNVVCAFNKSQKILQKLKLTTSFMGVLMMNTEKNLKELFLVKPFVCYGYINRSNFTNLMSKSLRLQFDGNIKVVHGNELIETVFKDYNFYCFEDLCNYIYRCEDDAELIINKYFVPFDFTFLKNDINFDFLQIESELAGNLKEKMNNVLEKLC